MIPLPADSRLPWPWEEANLPSLPIFYFLVLAILYCIYRDYAAFRSLGPGGTPSTPLGYLRVKFLGIFAIRDPYTAAPVPEHFRPQNGYLSGLPPRRGPRPAVRGVAPQRQMDQKVTRGENPLYEVLANSLRELAHHPRNKLQEGTSCFEKHGTGLFSTAPITRTCRGEICHLHPSEGSMHMCLHPADAKLVLERGWGQRHPLAKGGWFRRFVPKEFVMVYAPRDEKDIRTLMTIVSAAVWWVSGVNVGCGEDVGGGDGRLVEADAHGKCWSCPQVSHQVASVMQKA